MTREEKQKAIDALKISAPIMAVTQEEFKDYIQTLNKIMDWLEQEPQTGRWIESDAVLVMGYSETDNFLRIPAKECSVCHKPHIRAYRMNYCPHCGAKMAESEAEDGKDD